MRDGAGDLIRKARRALGSTGISQEQLAQRMTDLAQAAGVDVVYDRQIVGRLEGGRRTWRPKSDLEEPLWWAAKALGIMSEVERKVVEG